MAILVSSYRTLWGKGELECWVAVGRKKSSQNNDLHPWEIPHKCDIIGTIAVVIMHGIVGSNVPLLASSLEHSAGRRDACSISMQPPRIRKQPAFSCTNAFPMPLNH
jgi:hypothetical protein